MYEHQVHLFRSTVGGKKAEIEYDKIDKVVIVTGANSGIGKETVREFAKRSSRVIMACRDMEKCEKARAEIVLETGHKYVYCRPCDLASFKSIRKFVETFKKEHDRLDILINNAGIMNAPYSKTEDGIEMHLGVNHMGPFLLTNLLLDTLKASAPSRIINVTSIAYRRGEINTKDLNSEYSYDEKSAYKQSKLANVLFTRELAKRLQGTKVTVNCAYPGISKTDITRHMDFENSTFTMIFGKPFMSLFMKTPNQGAQTTIYAALEPSLENVSGKFFSNCQEDTQLVRSKDGPTGRWLWVVSEKWTGLASD